MTNNQSLNKTFDNTYSKFYKTKQDYSFTKLNKNLGPYSQDRSPSNEKLKMLNSTKLRDFTQEGYYKRSTNSVPIKRSVISRIFNDTLCV